MSDGPFDPTATLRTIAAHATSTIVDGVGVMVALLDLDAKTHYASNVARPLAEAALRNLLRAFAKEAGREAASDAAAAACAARLWPVVEAELDRLEPALVAGLLAQIAGDVWTRTGLPEDPKLAAMLSFRASGASRAPEGGVKN